MDLDQYDLELRLTDNTIKAAQNALTTALVAARDVKVNYGINSERIEGITTVRIKDDQWWSKDSPFVVTYETKNGKKGEIDVLKASITSLTEEADEDRVYNLLDEKKINAEYDQENLGYEGNIEALVGLSQNVNQELRANVWRKHLKRFGIDFITTNMYLFVVEIECRKILLVQRVLGTCLKLIINHS